MWIGHEEVLTMYRSQQKVIVRVRLTSLLIYAIHMYQKHLSKFFGDACRYSPSCSEYAIQAIRKHGNFKGTALAIRRILRCRPPYGGFDPIK